MDETSEFTTVFGRGLVEELPVILPRPYLIVTMADLWPRFAKSFDDGAAGVHLVNTLEIEALRRQAADLPACRAGVGIGGGQAVDVAKFFAWSLGYFHYDEIYGSVGAVVAVLTWSYVSSLILLFGAQLTAVFHREHPSATS